MQAFLSDNQLSSIKQWLGSGSINIFGLPFAGKDTHGHELAKLLGGVTLSGGQILRNSPRTPEQIAIQESGGLFPTDEYMRIVTPYLSRDEFAGKPLILSSVGRWIGEEQGVLAATEASRHPTLAVLYLTVNEETIYRRLDASKEIGDRELRADDSHEILGKRIQEFTNKTLPVIEEYRKLGLLIEINSDASREEVFDTILSRLLQRATS